MPIIEHPVSGVEIGDSTALVDTGRAEAVKRKSKAEARARKRAAKRKTRKGGALAIVPWVLTLTFASVAGFGGYYLYQKYDMTKESLTVAKTDAETANLRAAEADDRTMTVQAELSKARGEFVQASQKVEQATTEVEKKAAEVDELAAKLEALVSKNEGQVTTEADGRITLQLLDKVLFKSASAELTNKGMRVIRKVGEALKERPDKQIWIQGHTDNVPIANEEFGSNWELSAMRAVNVVHFLQDDLALDPARLAAVAFSQYRPSSKRKWRNRRIEIVLYPKHQVEVANR
jgi:chemotaxis protein MotB